MNEFHCLAFFALDIITLTETEPYDIPPPYQGMSISILFFLSPRRFSGNLVSMASECSNQSLSGRNWKSSLSKPPSLFPVLKFRLSGTSPVSAMYQVERMSSSVQRASPSALGFSYSPNALAFIPSCIKWVVLWTRDSLGFTIFPLRVSDIFWIIVISNRPPHSLQSPRRPRPLGA